MVGRFNSFTPSFFQITPSLTPSHPVIHLEHLDSFGFKNSILDFLKQTHIKLSALKYFIFLFFYIRETKNTE